MLAPEQHPFNQQEYMHHSSFLKMQAFKEKYLTGQQERSVEILDFGSQDINGSYRPIFDSPKWRYRGLDMVPGANVDIVLKNVYFWDELASESIDVVISGQAFEHTEFFWLSMLEIARILKPGGLCCILAPSGGQEHRYPVDCWRFYPDGMRAMGQFANLEVLEAWTDWSPPAEYGDGSDEWKDSVLIARRQGEPFTQKLKRRACRYVMSTLWRELPNQRRQ